MTAFDRYSALVEEYVGAMDYPIAPPELYDPIRYTMEEGGKRLRPLLVLGACGLWRSGVEEALPAAAAIEMFHNFTLMHDDIMDNAPLRRGRESVFKRWGTNVAILSGDSLMIYSYRELARVRASVLHDVIGYFNEAAIKVCEGQQLDMDFEARDKVSLPEFIGMIELKTAALFVGAVSMGAVIGGASVAQVKCLRDFALQFGIAFQMQDDLLDSYGDERLGKAVGGDILEGKKTFLKMLAQSSASANDLAELTMIHKDLRVGPEEKIARVLELYNKYDVRARVEGEISRRFAAAAQAIDPLAKSLDEAHIADLKTFAISQLGRSK